MFMHSFIIYYIINWRI